MLQTYNYNCQISQIFHFLWALFNAFKDLLLQFRERRKLHFRETNFTNFPGGAAYPRTPATTSCLRHSTFAPVVPLHPVLPNATENPESYDKLSSKSPAIAKFGKLKNVSKNCALDSLYTDKIGIASRLNDKYEISLRVLTNISGMSAANELNKREISHLQATM